MEWIERLNDVIGYIENHLIREIDDEQLGKIACCSSYNEFTDNSHQRARRTANEFVS